MQGYGQDTDTATRMFNASRIILFPSICFFHYAAIWMNGNSKIATHELRKAKENLEGLIPDIHMRIHMSLVILQIEGAVLRLEQYYM